MVKITCSSPTRTTTWLNTENALAIPLDPTLTDLWGSMLGETALRAGQVAVAVFNGSMAIRFGNLVKETVEVFDQKSFLGLKVEDLLRAGQTFARPSRWS